MKISVYKLLGRVKDVNVDYDYVKYYDRIKEKDGIMMACSENIIYKLEYGNIELNDEVEILEEPKEIPEKLEILPNNEQYSNKVLYGKVNEIIDYLESKGE